MVALILKFTSKCRSYCRIIIDYEWFSILTQHLVLLDNHIYVKAEVGHLGKMTRARCDVNRQLT